MPAKSSNSLITRIRAGNSQVYLVHNGSRSILVDAGIPRKAGRILAHVEKAGLSPHDVALIVITHAHFDHVGGLYALQRATGAAVLAHPYEAHSLRKGSGRFPAGTRPIFSLVSSVGQKLLAPLNRFHPVDAVQLIEETRPLDEYGIDGCILPTPGHTAGSISLILRDKVAIVGDTAFGIFRSTAYPPFADDPRALLESWRRLLDTGCRTFLPAHGRPVRRDLLQSGLDRRSKRVV